jgi:hypothetical protein
LQGGRERENDVLLCLRQIDSHAIRRNEPMTVRIDLHEQIVVPDGHADRREI